MTNLRGVLASVAAAALVAAALVAARAVTSGLPLGPDAPGGTGPPSTRALARVRSTGGLAWLANPAPPSGDFTTAAVDSFAAGPEGWRAAAARVGELRAAGFEAAALDSSGYSSLQPGFLLVYSGVFAGDDLDAARRRAAALRAAGVADDAYARHVSCWDPCAAPGAGAYRAAPGG
jgi:hypothetical protein